MTPKKRIFTPKKCIFTPKICNKSRLVCNIIYTVTGSIDCCFFNVGFLRKIETGRNFCKLNLVLMFNFASKNYRIKAQLMSPLLRRGDSIADNWMYKS